MKTIRSIGLLIALSSAVGIVGCATTMPPQDLVNARSAYQRASKGPAQQFDPADMHAAKQQLDVAEASFTEDGDTQDTRDQSYLALRKTELAEVIARTHAVQPGHSGVVSAMHADERKAVALTSAELGRTQDRSSPPRALRSTPRELRSRTRNRAAKTPRSALRKRRPTSPSSRR